MSGDNHHSTSTKTDFEPVAISPTTPLAPPRRAIGIVGGQGPERTRLTALAYDDGRMPTWSFAGVDRPGLDEDGLARAASPYDTARTAWDAWLVGSSPSVSPQHAEGHLGRPALLGFRPEAHDDSAWSPLFGSTTVSRDAGHLHVRADDPAAGLSLAHELEALAGGSLRARSRITNTGGTPYVVEALDVVVPVPDTARELLDFTGRWAREKQPQRHAIADGIWMREHRRGMRALDATSMIVVGDPGFGFGDGDVLGVHIAWSGNHRYTVERLSSGAATLRAGELLMPGEIVLGPGEAYETPWVHIAASSGGLDGLAAANHRYLRSLPSHPRRQPVMFNAWEAVYLDHDLEPLRDLAGLAAELGAERFVLDDGWFHGRHTLDAGLGDWSPDAAKWPDGIGPLADHVRRLGMEFGIWWEPEAVNPDSDLYRAHPEWVLAQHHRLPPLERDSLLLDLSNPDVRDHLAGAFDELVRACPVDFVKWDHNRDLIDAGLTRRRGAPAARAQTLGFYALLDRLRRDHPRIAWESCASGGGRIDLAILERVQGAWTSDNTDPLTRQLVQPWTAQLAPLEYLGSHLAESPSHQTGRATTIDFRGATAFMGQLGIQWDLRRTDRAERDRIAAWCRLYKEHRELLHTGRLTRSDLGPGLVVTGVVADDGSEAVFSYAQLDDVGPVPPRLRVRGLTPDAAYRVRRLAPDASSSEWHVDGLVLTGAVLAQHGLPGPARRPESAELVHFRRI